MFFFCCNKRKTIILVLYNFKMIINKEGNIIKGLYAEGEVTGGIHGGNRVGGNSLSDIFTFGRIAGKSAANNK